MKTLVMNRDQLRKAGRWDIDFHLPPEGILQFPTSLLKRVDEVATLVRDKRDPTREPESVFQYIDISSVDVVAGEIVTPQDLEGSEAPSRARKVVRAYDILVSTCRPTRGAIAVVPERLHDQIASTGFSVVRANDGVNPFYLHYALRLPSTLEQFRKFSTGSSYPAILDEDVRKTLIPVPSAEEQDRIAGLMMAGFRERAKNIHQSDLLWRRTIADLTSELSGRPVGVSPVEDTHAPEVASDIASIRLAIYKLRPVTTDRVAGKARGMTPTGSRGHPRKNRAPRAPTTNGQGRLPRESQGSA